MNGDLLDKLRAAADRVMPFEPSGMVPCDTVIDDVAGPCEVVIGGRRVLMFGSNNYFGFTCHPAVLASARSALEHYGTGTTGSRVANGTLAMHKALERDFATLFGKAEATIFTTGYQANLSLIGALCDAGDDILLDAESHASIWDAARLTGSTVMPFRHNSPEHLAEKLTRLPPEGRNRLVVIEGLYSIRADVAPVAEFLDVCRRHDAYLLVDEAHSFGAFGDRGLGCCEAQGVLHDVDFIVGTFSKALGAIGGFCVSNHRALRGLAFLGRAYIFTASGTPATIAGVRTAMQILFSDRSLRDRLWTNVRRLRDGLRARGFVIGDTEAPIVPIYIGDGARTVSLWQDLLRAGVYVNIVLPPACPTDGCLFRASCSAVHTNDQIDRALEIFEAAGSRLHPAMLGIPGGR